MLIEPKVDQKVIHKIFKNRKAKYLKNNCERFYTLFGWEDNTNCPRFVDHTLVKK